MTNIYCLSLTFALLFSCTLSSTFFTQDGSKLVGIPLGNASIAAQGTSVSLSGDGKTLAVGGPYDKGLATAPEIRGAVWIFTKSDITGDWTQQGLVLSANDSVGIDLYQGNSVSLSYDGNTLAVGAYGDEEVGPFKGASWIYTRLNGIWSQHQKLLANDATGLSRQGYSVSLSADGNTLAVGGPGDRSSGISTSGATWIYVRNSFTDVWEQEGPKIVGNASTASEQGSSVSLNFFGNVLAVGGYRHSNYSGAVWIFQRNASSFNRGTKLEVTDPSAGEKIYFGYSVSLNALGNKVAVGAPYVRGHGTTYIFENVDGTWTRTHEVIPNDAASYFLLVGRSVSLSGDGMKLVVGAPYSSGKTFVFQYLPYNNSWTQIADVYGSNSSATANQGSSVSISLSGSVIAVGGPRDASTAGATWVFTSNAPARLSSFALSSLFVLIFSMLFV